ncbi:MAG: hypothetical protein PHU61_02430 [Candidatus Absconditabacteria bacterium]|nr:hypothetical protein [Candidatus Absconditabacteria bacterium]MDD4714556.1 hypothetical protein [Candidatus Absconditabacteria bacterium]
MLNLFKVIKLTDSEEEMSWVPFYYLFKGKKKTKETQPQSKNVESEKKGRTDKKASGKTK